MPGEKSEDDERSAGQLLMQIQERVIRTKIAEAAEQAAAEQAGLVPPALKAGDVVKLKSGSHKMVI